MKAWSRIAVVLFLLTSIHALASVIPPLPEKMPPPARPAPYPAVIEKSASGERRAPLTKKDLDASSLTPIAYAMQLTALEDAARPKTAQPDTAGWGNIRLNYDTNEDVEPAPPPYSNVKTDIYFNSYSTTTQEWRGVRKVNHSSSINDQCNGALDFDDTG